MAKWYVESFRSVTVVGIVLFGISIRILLAASMARESSTFPRWVGIIDVSLVLALLLITYMIRRSARECGRYLTGTTEVAVATLVAMVMVAMWMFRARLNWNILLPGLAWRMFLLLQFIPAVIRLSGSNSR